METAEQSRQSFENKRLTSTKLRRPKDVSEPFDQNVPQHEAKFEGKDEFVTPANLSRTIEDILGQSTPLNISLDAAQISNGNTGTEETPYLDLSRVEVAEELQKQQNERLEKLWHNQKEQNKKIAEKLDESVIKQDRNSSLRKQHVRQIDVLRHYYEDEISGLKKELSSMKDNMFQHNQQENSLKVEIQKQFQAVSAANVDLSAKCDALAAEKRVLENQLKQVNSQKQEVEKQSQQLVATNQIIDTRSRELQRLQGDTGVKLRELEETLRKLQTQYDIVVRENDDLKTVKSDIDAQYCNMEECNRKLTDKCHTMTEELRSLEDRNSTQESLIRKSNIMVQDHQRTIENLTKESEDIKMRYEVDRSVWNATQQRVDRLVVQNRDKDLIITNLEQQIKCLNETIKEVSANTAKAGLNEIKNSVRRDKQHLQRVAKEYEMLNAKHEEAQIHVQHLENRLSQSQYESEHLKKELSELAISRKNLENSLREIIGNQNSCRRIVEQSSRRTWKESENFNFPDKEKSLNRDGSTTKESYPKYLESTRRESQLTKDEMVNLSPIQSRAVRDNNDVKFQTDVSRRRNYVVSAENRFLELNSQRRRLETALQKFPVTIMSKQEKIDKKHLEKKLDKVLNEIGKVRLQLKADNI